MRKLYYSRIPILKRGYLTLVALWIILPFPDPVSAQTVVSKPCNAMRPGDCLVKQQVEYKDPGREGENVLWNFSEQQLLDEHYRVNYYGVADSLLLGQEQGTLYHYLSGGDSLLLARVESRTTLIDNRKPELVLIYPIAYGDRYEDYFHGNGDYGDRLFITARGKVTVKADACGVLLLPQGDTLRNVLRIRHVKNISEQMVPYPFIQPGDTVYSPDSIEAHLSGDTLHMQVETYRWYAPGWRYPVFETVSNRFILHGQPKEYSRSSFYYKPVDQYYGLDSDPENQMARDEEQARLREAREKTQQNEPPEGKSREIIDYEVTLSDDNNVLNVEYCLNEDAEVSFLLFDMQGRQWSSRQSGRQPPGFYRTTFSLSGLPPGEYTLRIVAGGQVSGVKIIK